MYIFAVDKGVIVLNLMDEKRERHEFDTLTEAKAWLGDKEIIFAGRFFAGSLYLLPFDDHLPTLKECVARSGHKNGPLGDAHSLLDVVEARMCLVTDTYNGGLYSIVDDNLNDLETGACFVLFRNKAGHGYICRRELFNERFSSLAL